jgi:uncharacterized cupredoxin-like copper-binding protein
MSERLTGAIVAACAVLGATAAWAHEAGPHAARRFDPAQVEETAFGREGDPRQVARTIRIDMSDAMRFSPAAISVHKGDTVRFVVRNRGAVLHEMVLGTAAQLAEHAELMKKFPGMVHDEPSIAHVAPGKRGEIVWQFTKPGRFQFACLVPGHFEAGMVGTIAVE